MIAAADAPLTVLYSDEGAIAVHKPADLSVIPAPDEAPGNCLRHRLDAQLGARLWVVHRIDRDTSGVVVFARDAQAHRRLSMAFERRHVTKRYLAFTAGVPDPPAGTIDTPLHAARRGRMRPAAPGEDGLPSVTEYAVVRRWTRGPGAIALVEARPRTGRHHQIRVHLRNIGTPILFDAVYGQSRLAGELADAPCTRLALHAASIELPRTDGGNVRIDAPLADDLAALVGWLDLRWRPEPS